MILTPFLDDGDITLYAGDCIEVMRQLPEASIDAIITDPPYGLEFMGKGWDAFAPIDFESFNESWAREAFRVLKPGAHLLAFGGTRTYHRLAAGIEDAGFEIRDCLAYMYGSGFPKSLNVNKQLSNNACTCPGQPLPYNHAEASECEMRFVRNSNVQASVNAQDQRQQILLASVQKSGASAHREARHQSGDDRSTQSGMEGWRDIPETTRELCDREIRPGAGMGVENGAEGRVRDGAPLGHGADMRIPADKDRSCASRRSRPAEQRGGESGVVAGQSEPQAARAWPVCDRCGLPVVPDGLGTALKPAFEPIVLARKPLTGTVAANVLQHGTGALNINATRISVTDTDYANNFAGTRGHDQNRERASDYKLTAGTTPAAGRWPANVALDNTAAALLDEQSGERASSISLGDRGKRPGGFGDVGADKRDPRPAGPTYGDNGGASRFFYTAKASRQDRNTSGANNTHPTVKPTSLMRWLIRLTTPPGGIILDPFGGSGTTGVAARAENTRCILIEREDEYINIIRQRLAQLSLFSVPDEDAA